ncbi:phage integrase [Acetobacter pasteurianus 386B]|nr:phage integrase [Acetobacter pasteurianus 386B]
MLRQMFQYAFEHGWRQDNPVKDIKMLKYRKNPFPTWSEKDIRIFENFWPIGSRARLTLALFLYTGQRRSDVIRMGPARHQKFRPLPAITRSQKWSVTPEKPIRNC